MLASVTAQTNVPQGGTGTTTVGTGRILFGNSTLRLGASPLFTFSTTTNTLTVTNASTTALSGSGFTFTNGFVSTLLNATKAIFTNASTTGMTISGALHDGTGSLGVSGQVLSSTGSAVSWITPFSGAYASSTFVNYPYASTTFPSFTYSTTTFPTYNYATTTFPSFSYGTSTYVSGGYATTTFVTYQYATSTFPSFSYGTSTYAPLSGSTNYVTYTYATSTFARLFANLSTNNITATGTLDVTGKTTLGVASTTQLSASTGIFTPSAWVTSLTGTNASSTNSTSTNFFMNGGTAGSVVFLGTGGLLSQNNSNFFWDNVNNRLGLGTTTPTRGFTVASSSIQEQEFAWGTGTSTNMTVNFTARKQQHMRISTSAVSITIAPMNNGENGRISLCNPGADAAGAVTFFSSSTLSNQFTQVTTAGACQLISFNMTQGSSSPIVIIYGNRY